MAKVIICGNIGRDPEMRYMPDGTAVTNINVADNRQWNDKDGEKHKETTWFRVSFWGKLGEVINQYFHKGDPIYVEGRLRVNPETGGPNVFQRQDGSMGASFEVTATDFKFISGGNGGSSAGGGASEEEPEDIPF